MHDAETQKIKRRILLAKYPRRANARFADAPDPNPLVLEDCPRCGGRGYICDESEGCVCFARRVPGVRRGRCELPRDPLQQRRPHP